MQLPLQVFERPLELPQVEPHRRLPAHVDRWATGDGRRVSRSSAALASRGGWGETAGSAGGSGGGRGSARQNTHVSNSSKSGQPAIGWIVGGEQRSHVSVNGAIPAPHRQQEFGCAAVESARGGRRRRARGRPAATRHTIALPSPWRGPGSMLKTMEKLSCSLGHDNKTKWKNMFFFFVSCFCILVYF